MILRALLLVGFCLAPRLGLAQNAPTPANDRQIAVMMLVDYGRSYGYQVMMARIQKDKDQAQYEKDAQLLGQKKQLYERKAIPLVELEIAQLKDTWNRAQLVVSDKSLEYVQAEYAAMTQLARHYGRSPDTTEAIYATFRRGWDAGCAKGPAEVEAAKARLDFLEKLTARTEQLLKQRNVSYSILLDRKAQLELARSEYRNRAASIDSCQKLLFPSLEEIMQVGR